MWTLVKIFIVFGTGASITRLIVADKKPFAGLRARWQQHFTRAVDDILFGKVLPNLSPDPAAWNEDWADKTRYQRRIALIREVERQQGNDAPLPFFASRKAHRRQAPWGEFYDPLVKATGRVQFIDCPWCVGFWVFLVTWAVAIPVLWDWSTDFGGVPLCVWWVPLALTSRWVNGLLGHFDET